MQPTANFLPDLWDYLQPPPQLAYLTDIAASAITANQPTMTTAVTAPAVILAFSLSV
jgi:hypothetical protein